MSKTVLIPIRKYTVSIIWYGGRKVMEDYETITLIALVMRCMHFL